VNLNLVIPPKLKKPLIWVGYPLFAIVVMTMTMFLTIPSDRVKFRIESVLSADPMSGAPGAINMDVSIGDLSLTLFTGAGIKAKDIVLYTRPVDVNVKPARYLINDVTFHVGLLGLLFNRPTYSFKAHALSGTVSGQFALSPSEERIKIEADGLVLTNVPAIAASVGLPLEGTVSGKLEAVAAKAMAANLEGTLDVTLDDAVIGDGKAKLTVPGDPFMAQGITFPKLKLGKIVGKIVMEKGRGRIEDLHVKSGDGEATIDGYVELRDPLAMSQVHAYLRFKPTEALVKREPTVELMNNALGGTARRPDGFLGFQLTGPLQAVFALPNVNPPPGVTLKLAGPSTVPSVVNPPAGATSVPPPGLPTANSVHLPPPPMPSQPQPYIPPEPNTPEAVPEPTAVPPPPPPGPPVPVPNIRPAYRETRVPEENPAPPPEQPKAE
jgi:type II secretion system protein N